MNELNYILGFPYIINKCEFFFQFLIGELNVIITILISSLKKKKTQDIPLRIELISHYYSANKTKITTRP